MPAALAFSGCGDTVSLDPVAKAADATSHQTSEHMAMTATVTAGTQLMTMSAEGDFRNDPNLGRMTMIMTSGSRQISTQVVLQGPTIYMTTDLFRGRLPDGKTWMELDLAKATKSLGVDLGSSLSQSPADTLARLRASGGQVTKVGPARVAGVATTHYSAILDPDKIAKLTKAFHVTVSYAPVDVWVDAHGLVRKLHLAYVQDGSGSLPAASMQMTMILSGYGEPVRVTVPPASETFDATRLAGALER